MDNQWNDAAAQQAIEDYGHAGEDLALRTYTTRLLGKVPQLVLHGGGNTSVKTRVTDLLGDEYDVLCVKGSGWDMAFIEPPGLPAVKMEPLLKARALDALSDEAMVALQRSSLIDPGSPNPSVETLLHAFLPHKFVDHTHSTAILALVDQESSRELIDKVFGARMGFVPYIPPGFELAKAAADVFDENPQVEGLILDKHGIFTFGDTARQAYDRMIAAINEAEAYIAENGKPPFTPRTDLPANPASALQIAPVLRGAVAEALGEGCYNRFVCDFRTSPAILDFINGADLEDYALRGVTTPDLTIHVKNWPVILPPCPADDVEAWAEEARKAVQRYTEMYRAYFETNNARDDIERTILDPMPRMAIVPGLGIFGFGRTAKTASISGDVAEVWSANVADAEAIGKFYPLPAEELFKLEYWSLEQAKLKSRKVLPLTGQVALVTGGAGGIGAATAKLFATTGAHVVVADLDGDAAAKVAKSIGNQSIGVACDVTDAQSVRAAFDAAVEAFGGVDIVISNAGAAFQGEIGTLDDAVLRTSFELNFFAHQSVAQNAVRIFKMQQTGGVLLFNTSKQAINPGANFGAYGVPKAATLFLSRQYALEYGKIGVRSSAVNADRIRSGLLDDSMIASRSKARGVSEKEYMSGNLLKQEVTADHVAKAFLDLAMAERTTAGVLTVDGGNIEAALR
ncbi:bifunctional aldolase/short-chain dehydrogenase [Hoeflea sp. WL0058]|uniref:Bifunctional aldolase/short-chain dehydrogenase n=1 Tax=Flavimaribacter sediminis TaxID=2865987 RepID=A0AAE3D1J1_9HYPH|nr:bifunctional aldolase/short-chain dehydrogenase [Flavimaribacter sediminis]MBW8637673.1 bifunctional aldolase/short-chain dehydrogenase [Flavimaribacter sediminis]